MKAKPLVCALLVLLIVTVQLPAQQKEASSGTNTTFGERDNPLGIETRQPVSPSKTNATVTNKPRSSSTTITPPAGLVLGQTPFDSSHVKTTPLVLSNGVVLEIVKIDSIDPDGLNVTYLHRGSNSLDPSWRGFIDRVKIPFELLSKEVQKKYNYEPAAADAYRKQIAAAYAEYRKAVEERNERIAAQEAKRRKDELDLEIKIRTLLALEEQVSAQQRQADAQEDQALRQQQINRELEDLNWQLMRLRQENRRY